ncbi:MAG TPA: GspH/FimT family pseudopilin [Desulfobacteraceae bacterium]|nr:GspH/FimT family pseudopilin [Desulfobacteraceae bacterium]HPJ67693.1 GspH/FimT family pseudopilin [Desulfobacteraceae bacterium]HPQ29570.1 GspH/FimT family pseudopilin [Desulfobacteraceae bacterium]
MDRKSEHGFTLVELVIAIVVIAVMVGMAVPAVIHWLPDYRLKSAARHLVANFQRAKIEAVKRNTNIVLEFQPAAFSPGGGVGSYLIFADDGSGGGVAGDDIRNGTEPVIASVTMPKNVSLYNTNYGSDKAIFNPRGFPAGTATRFVEMRNNNSRFYRTSVAPVGGIRLEASSDGVTWKN